VVDLWKSARLPSFFTGLCEPAVRYVDRALSTATALGNRPDGRGRKHTHDRVYDTLLIAVTAALLFAAVRFVVNEVSLHEVAHAALLGLATAARVIFLLIVSTLIWTPIAVAIGFSPKLAKISQPVIQVLASFPANFVFPFATLAFLKLGVSLNWGSILLMALGSQWYLLFNIIGGAQSIPNDLREMAASIGLRRARAWRSLIGPGIFASWVTGAITASGGAWNASIVSELVSWGNSTLSADGLGAYISRATAKGDWPRIVLGVGLMSVFVVGFNRLLWRRLYTLAESKYRIA
jgi:NitT/TauT family transport system permease protein